MSELSKEVQSMLDGIKKLTVVQVVELVKAMEDEFSVSAAAMAAPAAAPVGGAGGEAAEEKLNSTL